MTEISGVANTLQTYSSEGQLKTQSLEGHKDSLFSNYVKNAIDHSRAHEQAAIDASQNKISTQELVNITTRTELVLQEFHAMLNKAINALSDITKTSI